MLNTTNLISTIRDVNWVLKKTKRILIFGTIVDTFDVMTSHRPYKQPVSEEDALNEIKRCSGSQFDPNLVEIFMETMRQK
jgi:response regulator RpfG family c-di-GMP phosphodiesterase